MKKSIMTLMLAVVAMLPLQAQIDSKVKDVVQKCVKAMQNPAGVEYNMDFKVGMGEVDMMSCHIVASSKGKLSKALVTAKVFGIEAKSETGFDGTDVRTGLTDEYFRFDPQRYPDAVVIRN